MIALTKNGLARGLHRKLTVLIACCAIASGVSAATASSDPYKLPDEIAEAEAFAIGYQAFIVGAVYARSQLLMEKDTHPGARLNAPLNAFNV